MIYRRTISVVLFFSVILFSFSCGDKVTPTETSSNAGTTEPVTTQPDYNYPTADYEGHEFIFLNQDSCNWANRLIVPEETNGDLINDEMYARNLRVEERFNIKIKEIAVSRDDIASLTRNAVSAGDETYDVVMTPIDVIGGLLLDGNFVELSGISSLNLDSPWWDKAVVEAATLKDNIYFASSDISFFPFEATWVIYFNENRFEKLGIEYPYQLVRDGKWTIDKLIEYTKLGASLNGQESYSYNEKGGTADYGMITHGQFVEALVFGSGESFLTTEGGIPKFYGESNKMYTIYEKIAELTKTEGAFLDRDDANLSDPDKSPSIAFKSGRFMIFAETLGHISNLRDFNGDFGVVPVPKLDEKQDGYQSMMASWGTQMTTIPASASNPERTGVILDALAYDSYKNLMEPYYETYLSQKGARNEDSAEMLRMIRDTRTINVGKMYGWTSSVISNLITKLMAGNPDVASTIATDSPAVAKAIEKTLTVYGK